MDKTLVIAASAIILSGCASSSLNYTPPVDRESIQNSVLIRKPRDEVWRQLVPRLSKEFYVINNLDKDSGLINVSYSSDAERIVDCGRIRATFSTLVSDRTYDFSGSAADQTYQQMVRLTPYAFRRQISLDGRANITLEATTPATTTVTVNTRYVVTRSLEIGPLGTPVESRYKHTVSFNTNTSGVLPSPTPPNTRCRATGELEQSILKLVQ